MMSILETMSTVPGSQQDPETDEREQPEESDPGVRQPRRLLTGWDHEGRKESC